MKRLLIMLALSVIFLTGCVNQKDPPVTAGQTVSSDPTASSTVTDTSGPDTQTTVSTSESETSPAADSQTDSSETTVPSESEPVTPLPAWVEVKAENGEIRIIFPDTIRHVSSFYILDGKMYVSCQNLNAFGLAMFDVRTGSFLDFYELGEGYISELDENAFLYYTYEGKNYFVSREEPLPFLLELPEQDGRYFYFSDRSLLLEDANTLGEITGYDRNGEMQFHASLGSAFTFVPICKTNGIIYAAADCGQGVCLISIHSENGNWENFGFLGSTSHDSFHDNIMVCDYSSNTLRIWDKDGNLQSDFPLVESYCYITACNDRYVALQGSLYTVVFDLEGNVRYAESNSRCDSQIVSCQFEDDFFYTLTQSVSNDGSITLSKRNLDAFPPVDLNTALGLPCFPNGVTILTGENADLNTPSYKCEPVYDEEENIRAYNILLNITKQFPDGFFEELLGENCMYNSLVFRYVDHLYGTETNTLDSAGGLSYQEGCTQYICIARNMIDEPSLIYHEIMHCIESCMESRGIYFDSWYAYLPESFFFTYNYSMEGDHTYTDPWEPDPDNVWFPSSYSKITPSEDRASLFGLLMTDNPYYFRFSHIADRANYLAAVLKDVFPSLRSCPQLT